ncbi:hypothetical protein INR49_019060 [Caranx melampygus]|nr:hypothetical protein INR49_019060 [Caranx melampygus]
MTDSCFYQSFPRLVARHPIRARWEKRGGRHKLNQLPAASSSGNHSYGQCLGCQFPQPPPSTSLGQRRLPRVDGAARLRDAPGVVGHPPPAASGQEQEAEPPLPNPGAFDECHRKCKEVFPMQMEGVRLVVNKGLSNHFQVNHTVLLSTMGDSTYRFGATYVGSKQTGPAEFFPVMVGDMDNSGSLNAQIIHQVSSRIRSKLAFQVC